MVVEHAQREPARERRVLAAGRSVGFHAPRTRRARGARRTRRGRGSPARIQQLPRPSPRTRPVDLEPVRVALGDLEQRPALREPQRRAGSTRTGVSTARWTGRTDVDDRALPRPRRRRRRERAAVDQPEQRSPARSARRGSRATATQHRRA